MCSADDREERRKPNRTFKLSLLSFSGGKPFVADTNKTGRIKMTYNAL